MTISELQALHFIVGIDNSYGTLQWRTRSENAAGVVYLSAAHMLGEQQVFQEF